MTSFLNDHFADSFCEGGLISTRAVGNSDFSIGEGIFESMAHSCWVRTMSSYAVKPRLLAFLKGRNRAGC